jgi:hypothetical protein
MSKIALSPNINGTGTFTIASPNSNADRTVNLPDAGGDMVLTTATQTLTNKDIVATQLTGDVAAARITTALNASGSAPIYACRAWVNFDGTGTPAIREDGNVSSLTDLGVGQWLVNFTTSMPDANYCAVATCNEVDNATTCQSRLPATSNIAIDVYTSPSGLSASRADPTRVNVAIFR